MIQSAFLTDSHIPRSWTMDSRRQMQPEGLFLGKGSNALEVAVARSQIKPRKESLLRAWKSRKGGRAAPLLLVVLHPEGVSVCGAAGVEPPVFSVDDPSPVEGMCRLALDKTDRHSALRFLSDTLPSLETALPGISNNGLLAMHDVQHGVPEREDWPTAGQRARRTKGKGDQDLLRALGFRVERLDNLTSLLRSGSKQTALAIMLHDKETPEGRSDRFSTLSPVFLCAKEGR